MQVKALTFNNPSVCTKRLKLQSTGDNKRKLIISTNWLPLFGFEAGSQTVEEVIGAGKGLTIRSAQPDEACRTKKVYQRTYKSRRNNPLETMLDIRGQVKINEAFGDCNQVHITFKQDLITIIPVSDQQAQRIKTAKSTPDMMRAFVACSSGIDAHSISQHGFKIDALLDWRPRESRDKKDLTETGALCAISNLKIDKVFNEDIFTIDTQMLKKAVEKNKTALFSVSTQCDDFSNVKSKFFKERSMQDLSTSSDMIYDVMRIIEQCQFPYILLENVPQLLKTDYHKLFETKLRRWGYKVYSDTIDASALGGCSRRKRAYVFATTFTEVPFSFPEARAIKGDFWVDNVVPFLEGCRDVSHSKSIQDGANIGRLRVVTKDSTVFPTLLKSQSRMAKDSMVILHEGKYLFPSEALERHIMGIPSDFTLEAQSKSIASEILGQAVEYISHGKIIEEVKKHIQLVQRSFKPLVNRV